MLCIIALSSVTYAMKGEELLRTRGVSNKVVRLSPGRTKKGCGYGLEIEKNRLAAALQLLRGAGIPPGEVIQ